MKLARRGLPAEQTAGVLSALSLQLSDPSVVEPAASLSSDPGDLVLPSVIPLLSQLPWCTFLILHPLILIYVYAIITCINLLSHLSWPFTPTNQLRQMATHLEPGQAVDFSLPVQSLEMIWTFQLDSLAVLFFFYFLNLASYGFVLGWIRRNFI